MSNTKHTPGPWNASLVYRGENWNIAASGRLAVVECFNDDAEANARLIAAAPELLDLLIEAVDLSDRVIAKLKEKHPDDPPRYMRTPEAQYLYERVSAAIAKATGAGS